MYIKLKKLNLKNTSVKLSSVFNVCFIFSSKGKGKAKVHPRTGHEGPEGEKMCSSTLPSTSSLDGLGG